MRPEPLPLVALTVLLALDAGCAVPSSRSSAWNQPTTALRKVQPTPAPARPSSATSAAAPASGQTKNRRVERYPQVRVVEESVGRVLQVNLVARIAVIDFAYHAVPTSGTRMAVIRSGEKVGVLRVTGLPQQGLMAADLFAGEVQAGDEVWLETTASGVKPAEAPAP